MSRDWVCMRPIRNWYRDWQSQKVRIYLKHSVILRKWCNWQTRTSQKRMGQPLRVQLPPSAPVILFIVATLPFNHLFGTRFGTKLSESGLTFNFVISSPFAIPSVVDWVYCSKIVLVSSWPVNCFTFSIFAVWSKTAVTTQCLNEWFVICLLMFNSLHAFLTNLNSVFLPISFAPFFEVVSISHPVYTVQYV